MSQFMPAVWNVLHDGTIDRIEATASSDVRLHVSIEYIRERFADPGDMLIVTLHDCRRLAFRCYESDRETTDFEAIAGQSPTILSAEMHDGLCRTFTDAGVLETECRDGSISLDSGRSLTLQDLKSGSSLLGRMGSQLETRRTVSLSPASAAPGIYLCGRTRMFE